VPDIGPGWSAIAGAVIGGAIAGLVAWKVALVTTQAEDRRQSAQHVHDRALVEEERRQARLSQCYETATAHVGGVTLLIQFWQPGQPIPAARGTEEEVVRLTSSVLIFGSQRAGDLFREWVRPTNRFVFVARELDTLSNRPERRRGRAWQQQWDGYIAELERLRGEVATSATGMFEQIRSELGSP
jgi:hypothetical protein